MSERKILKNILSLSFAELASKGTTFFLYAYITHTISVAGFGELSYINSILSYLLQGTLAGTYFIGLRESAKDKNNIQQYFSNITSIKLILASVCFLGVVLYVLNADISAITRASLLIGSIQFFAVAVLIDWVFISQELMHIIALRQVILNIMNFAGVVLFVHSAADIPIYMLVVSMSMLLNNLWLINKGSKLFFKLRLAFDRSLIKSIFKQAVPLSLSYFIITFMAQFGILYLSATCGKYETGLFSAAVKIAGFAIIPAFIVQGSFAARIAKRTDLAEQQNIAQKYTTMLITIGAIVSVTMFFFPEFLVYASSGADFMESATLVKIVSAYVMFYYTSNATVSLFFQWGWDSRILPVYAIGAVIYTVAGILLINNYGSTGAAWAMLACDGSLAVMFIWLLHKHINGFYIKALPALLLGAIVACALGKALNSFWQENIYFHAIGIIVAVVLFGAIVLKFNIISKDDIAKLIKKQN